MSFKRLLLAFVAIAMVVIACEKQPKPTPPKPTPPTPTTVKVTGVSLNKSSHEMAEGESITLTATVAPSDATNKKVSWSSSNNAIATVNPEGKVTAVSVGEAIITATSQDGNHTASCTLTVESNSVDVYMSVTNIVSIYKNGVAMKDLPYKSTYAIFEENNNLYVVDKTGIYQNSTKLCDYPELSDSNYCSVTGFTIQGRKIISR